MVSQAGWCSHLQWLSYHTLASRAFTLLHREPDSLSKTPAGVHFRGHLHSHSKPVLCLSDRAQWQARTGPTAVYTFSWHRLDDS